MYGIQTCLIYRTTDMVFENDVKMYGIQTFLQCSRMDNLFENDVKMYGIQTNTEYQIILHGLRMM